MITEKSIVNFSSNNSDFLNDLNESSGSILGEMLSDGNYFLTFHNSHKQQIYNKTTFSEQKSVEFLGKLDDFLESERKKIKKMDQEHEFKIEFICEINDIFLENSFKENKKFRFAIITSTMLYEFEFEQSKFTLKNIIILLYIDFISLTSDYKNVILHMNNSLQTSGNYILTHIDNGINIAFLISNLVYSLHNFVKPLVIIPSDYKNLDKFKLYHSYNRFQEFYNKYCEEIYNSMDNFQPYDEGENFIKLIPLNRIMSKFTEILSERLLIITSRKLMEIEIIPDSQNCIIDSICYSKLKKILYNKNKLQFILDDSSSIYKYSTIYSSIITHSIKQIYLKNNYYSELKVIKTNI